MNAPEISANDAHELLKGLLQYCEVYQENAHVITVADVMADLESTLLGEVAESVWLRLQERVSAVCPYR